MDVEDGKTERAALDAGIPRCWYRPHALRAPETRVVDLARYWLGAGEDVFGRVALEALPDFVCVLLPTSPLRTIRHLVESRLLLSDAVRATIVEGEGDLAGREMDLRFSVDGVMSVTPFRQDTAYALRVDDGMLALRFDPTEVRPAFKQDVVHDGTVIWVRSSALLALPPEANFYALNLRPYVVSSHEAVDINEPSDLVIAEALLAYREGG
jgi:hypothetical protein